MKTTKTAKAEAAQTAWELLEDPPEEAESMKLRSKLVLAVQDRIRASGASQSASAKLLGLTLPHFLELMDGRIDLFSVEALVDIGVRLGMKIELRVKPVP